MKTANHAPFLNCISHERFKGIISIILGPRETKSKPVDKINYEYQYSYHNDTK